MAVRVCSEVIGAFLLFRTKVSLGEGKAVPTPFLAGAALCLRLRLDRPRSFCRTQADRFLSTGVVGRGSLRRMAWPTVPTPPLRVLCAVFMPTINPPEPVSDDISNRKMPTAITGRSATGRQPLARRTCRSHPEQQRDRQATACIELSCPRFATASNDGAHRHRPDGHRCQRDAAGGVGAIRKSEIGHFGQRTCFRQLKGLPAPPKRSGVRYERSST